MQIGLCQSYENNNSFMSRHRKNLTQILSNRFASKKRHVTEGNTAGIDKDKKTYCSRKGYRVNLYEGFYGLPGNPNLTFDKRLRTAPAVIENSLSARADNSS